MNSPSRTPPSGSKEHVSQNDRIQRTIDILQDGRLLLLTALIKVLDPSEKNFAMHRDRFYACPKDQPNGKVGRLLDKIYEDPRGHAQLLSWLDLHITTRVTQKVSDEMDDIKDNLRAHIAHIMPDFLENWDITLAIGGAITKHAPILSEILRSAAQTERAKRENTTKDCTIVGIISIHLLFSYA